MPAASKKKSVGKRPVKAAQEFVKVSVPLPPEVHRALALASVDTGISNTRLILETVQDHFRATPKGELRLLSQAAAQDWKRVSVFLPVTLKTRAAHEVHRQHGRTNDKRFSGSLASAIAALVAAKYLPDYQV